jgi:3-hydroxyacyl-CoA dehydrogenase
MIDFVSLEICGDISTVAVNNPPVNALSPGVKDALITAMRRSESDGRVQAILLIGSGSTFIAGADIREFEKMAAGLIKPEVGLHPLMQALEDCVKPVVCVIHGAALGGGFEVAMACHCRLASPSAKVGLPEVKLGLIPGAGGTQRLPRLAGHGHHRMRLTRQRNSCARRLAGRSSARLGRGTGGPPHEATCMTSPLFSCATNIQEAASRTK